MWARTPVLLWLLLVAATTPALPEGVRERVAAAPAADDIFIYHVKDGENLPAIAQKWFVDPENWRALQALNRIADPLQVATGTALQVRRAWVRTQPLDARVVAFRGEVTLARAGKAVAVGIGTIVREADALHTGRNGFATLALPDGSRVSLPSASTIRMARLRQAPMSEEVDRQFALSAGGVDAQVTPMRNPRSRFLVQTPVAVAAVRGTRFRVSYVPADRRATVEVTQGKVEVTRIGTPDSVLLHMGFGAAATDSHLTPAIPLLQMPTLDGDDAGQSGRIVSFHLQPVAGARRYVGEIATDAGFVNRIARVESDQPLLHFADIPAGSLHLRAAAVDDYGLIGKMTEFGFERRPPATAGLPQAPLSGVTLLDDVVVSGRFDRSGWWTIAGAAGGEAAGADLADADAVVQMALADATATESVPAVVGGAPVLRRAFAAAGFGDGFGGGGAGAGGAGSSGGAGGGGVRPPGPDAGGAVDGDGSDGVCVIRCTDDGAQPDGGQSPESPRPEQPLLPGGSAPIPEPAAWALMISGFGLVGGWIRARRRRLRHG